MTFIKQYFKKNWLKNSESSILSAVDQDSFVTVLYDEPADFELVKRHFKNSRGVRFVAEKRAKDVPMDKTRVHTNDFDFRGTPKEVWSDVTKNKHFIINLCKDDTLAWYWYTRKYALRVDLKGIYQNADFTVAGSHELATKLSTLVEYLKMINHE